MWYGVGAIVLFNLLVFAFMYGAGKANKAWDDIMEKNSVQNLSVKILLNRAEVRSRRTKTHSGSS